MRRVAELSTGPTQHCNANRRACSVLRLLVVRYDKPVHHGVEMDVSKTLTQDWFNGLEVRYLLWESHLNCKGSRVRIPVGPFFATSFSPPQIRLANIVRFCPIQLRNYNYGRQKRSSAVRFKIPRHQSLTAEPDNSPANSCMFEFTCDAHIPSTRVNINRPSAS